MALIVINPIVCPEVAGFNVSGGVESADWPCVV